MERQRSCQRQEVTMDFPFRGVRNTAKPKTKIAIKLAGAKQEKTLGV